jgi:hypothetical protein
LPCLSHPNRMQKTGQDFTFLCFAAGVLTRNTIRAHFRAGFLALTVTRSRGIFTRLPLLLETIVVKDLEPQTAEYHGRRPQSQSSQPISVFP